MNDHDLERRVSRALHELFPEPVDATPYVPGDHQTRPSRTPAVGATVGLVLATGLAIGLFEAVSRSHGAATPELGSSQSTSSSIAETPVSAPPSSALPTPRWALECLPKQSSEEIGPAPEYVGLARPAAERLAQQHGDQLVFAGGGGECSNVSDDVFRTNPVAVVYDVRLTVPSGSTGPLPASARIVAAVRVSPGWQPGT